jgi:hypothetical protein
MKMGVARLSVRPKVSVNGERDAYPLKAGQS